MNCTNCGRAHGVGARFCGGCGKPVAPRCAACGAETPPDAQFCETCGASLAPRPADDADVVRSRPRALSVAIVADGRITRLEPFEPEHLDAALARFAELGRSDR